MSVRLSPAELEEITERERPTAQARILTALGIPFRAHPVSGKLIVYRHDLPAGMAGKPKRRRAPVFDHIRSRAA